MPTRRRALGSLLIVAGALLAGCTNNSNYFSSLPSLSSTPGAAPAQRQRSAQARSRSRSFCRCRPAGNAGLAGQAMRNAAEMAFAEFNANANIQLLMKDDAGTPEGARVAAEQALNEGAEIIVGPLFAQSVQCRHRSRARATFRNRLFDRYQRRDNRCLSVRAFCRVDVQRIV